MCKSDTQKCLNCEIDFLPVRIGQKHCSLDCRKMYGIRSAMYRHHFKCLSCGCYFYTSFKNQKCCSPKCFSVINYKNNYDLLGNKKCAKCGNMNHIDSYSIKSNGNGKKKLNPYCKDCMRTIDTVKRLKRRMSSRQIDSAIDIIFLFERYNWICCNCGCDTPKSLRGKFVGNAPELDHIKPISKGGTHTIDNLQLLCRNCNLKKSNKYAETGI